MEAPRLISVEMTVLEPFQTGTPKKRFENSREYRISIRDNYWRYVVMSILTVIFYVT